MQKLIFSSLFTSQINIIPNPVFVEFANISIRYYGIFIAIGVILGLYLALKQGKKKQLDLDIVYDLIIYGTISGIIGGRLLHVISNAHYYTQNPSKILAIWNGGLSLHGGLFLGVLTLVIYLKFKKAPILKYLDIVAPSMVLAQAIGRWGNYFNQEAFGLPTNLPWGIFIEETKRPLIFSSYEYFHPTFFYEFLSNIFIFILLISIRNKKFIKDGEITFIYLILYSFFRLFIEILRTDSVYIGTLKLEQILSVIIIIIASIFIYHRRFKQNIIN